MDKKMAELRAALEGIHSITSHKGPVCDFCLKPDPRWSFDGPTMHAPVQEVKGHLVSISDVNVWASCTRCSMLVKTKRIERLAEVAAQEGMARMGLPYTELQALEHQASLLVDYRRVVPLFSPRRVRSKTELEATGELEIKVTDPTTN